MLGRPGGNATQFSQSEEEAEEEVSSDQENDTVDHEVVVPSDTYYSVYDKLCKDIVQGSQSRLGSIIDKYTCLAHGLTPPSLSQRKNTQRRSLLKYLEDHRPNRNKAVAFDRSFYSPNRHAPTMDTTEDDLVREVQRTLEKRKIELGLPADYELREVEDRDFAMRIPRARKPDRDRECVSPTGHSVRNKSIPSYEEKEEEEGRLEKELWKKGEEEEDEGRLEEDLQAAVRSKKPAKRKTARPRKDAIQRKLFLRESGSMKKKAKRSNKGGRETDAREDSGRRKVPRNKPGGPGKCLSCKDKISRGEMGGETEGAAMNEVCMKPDFVNKRLVATKQGHPTKRPGHSELCKVCGKECTCSSDGRARAKKQGSAFKNIADENFIIVCEVCGGFLDRGSGKQCICVSTGRISTKKRGRPRKYPCKICGKMGKTCVCASNTNTIIKKPGPPRKKLFVEENGSLKRGRSGKECEYSPEIRRGGRKRGRPRKKAKCDLCGSMVNAVDLMRKGREGGSIVRKLCLDGIQEIMYTPDTDITQSKLNRPPLRLPVCTESALNFEWKENTALSSKCKGKDTRKTMRERKEKDVGKMVTESEEKDGNEEYKKKDECRKIILGSEGEEGDQQKVIAMMESLLAPGEGEKGKSSRAEVRPRIIHLYMLTHSQILGLSESLDTVLLTSQPEIMSELTPDAVAENKGRAIQKTSKESKKKEPEEKAVVDAKHKVTSTESITSSVRAENRKMSMNNTKKDLSTLTSGISSKVQRNSDDDDDEHLQCSIESKKKGHEKSDDDDDNDEQLQHGIESKNEKSDDDDDEQLQHGIKSKKRVHEKGGDDDDDDEQLQRGTESKKRVHEKGDDDDDEYRLELEEDDDFEIQSPGNHRTQCVSKNKLPLKPTAIRSLLFTMAWDKERSTLKPELTIRRRFSGQRGSLVLDLTRAGRNESDTVGSLLKSDKSDLNLSLAGRRGGDDDNDEKEPGERTEKRDRQASDRTRNRSLDGDDENEEPREREEKRDRRERDEMGDRSMEDLRPNQLVSFPIARAKKGSGSKTWRKHQKERINTSLCLTLPNKNRIHERHLDTTIKRQESRGSSSNKQEPNIINSSSEKQKSRATNSISSEKQKSRGSSSEKQELRIINSSSSERQKSRAISSSSSEKQEPRITSCSSSEGGVLVERRPLGVNTKKRGLKEHSASECVRRQRHQNNLSENQCYGFPSSDEFEEPMKEKEKNVSKKLKHKMEKNKRDHHGILRPEECDEMEMRNHSEQQDNTFDKLFETGSEGDFEGFEQPYSKPGYSGEKSIHRALNVESLKRYLNGDITEDCINKKRKLVESPTRIARSNKDSQPTTNSIPPHTAFPHSIPPQPHTNTDASNITHVNPYSHTDHTFQHRSSSFSHVNPPRHTENTGNHGVNSVRSQTKGGLDEQGGEMDSDEEKYYKLRTEGSSLLLGLHHLSLRSLSRIRLSMHTAHSQREQSNNTQPLTTSSQLSASLRTRGSIWDVSSDEEENGQRNFLTHPSHISSSTTSQHTSSDVPGGKQQRMRKWQKYGKPLLLIAPSQLSRKRKTK